MADLGMLDLPSLSMSTLHFRDAMDLLGAKVSVARVGDFKGAVEPFTLSEMSEGLRAHYKEMLRRIHPDKASSSHTTDSIKSTPSSPTTLYETRHHAEDSVSDTSAFPS